MDNYISIKKLSKSFDENKVLDNINLEIKTGQVTSIIGPSGSGKSTLLRCLNKLEKPNQGEIIYNNTNLLDNKVNNKQVLSKIQMVFQSFNLFTNLSVLDNCVIGQTKVLKRDKDEAKTNAIKFLEKVGMKDFINRNVSTLSGGQRQRVAIARTLSMSPEVILFDEPTSALDPEMVKEVLEVIRNIITKEQTFIIVTHEMNFSYEVSDTVIFMDQGKIVEIGDKSILKNPKSERLTRFLN
ncbi:ABC transporter [Candidatus Izimaplasma bacterium ZiA1]|uniref:amino acid ABC transporter ATP-binding protein n=1 Tax=Candidatus Izimoplasma sp. ZiA1 TaxID=2024899 RepID=UPI000BAA7896|nr:ABC transporter [Candidatus Izimaplasma bacterium ZiA1]